MLINQSPTRHARLRSRLRIVRSALQERYHCDWQRVGAENRLSFRSLCPPFKRSHLERTAMYNRFYFN